MGQIEDANKVETNNLKYLICAIWFVCGVRGPFQNDTWWHLATGRFIWTQKQFPLTDTFSWVTPPNTYWPNHEWLSELGMYLLYSLGGSSAMHLLCGMLFSATGYLIWRASSSKPSITFLVMLLLLPWLATGAAIRPHVLSMAFIAGLLVMLKERRYFLLPPLFLLWAQIHGGVCIGGAILAIWTIGCFLFDRQSTPIALITTGLSGAAAAINPIGLDLLYHPFRSTSVSRTLPLIEWASPFSMHVLGGYFGILVILLSVGGIITLVKGGDSRSSIQMLTTLALLPLACIHARTVSLLMPVLVPAVMVVLERIPKLAEFRIKLSSRLSYALVVLCGCSALLSIVELSSTPTEHPVSEMGASALQKAPGRFFNTYDSGGYLIWFVPEQKVFIDSRQDPYPPQLLQEAIMVQRTGDYRQFFQNFEINSVVVERHFPLHEALKRDGWSIRYRSPMFDLLVSPSSRTDALSIDSRDAVGRDTVGR